MMEELTEVEPDLVDHLADLEKEQEDASPAPSSSQPRQSRTTFLLALGVTLCIAAAAVAGARWWNDARKRVTTDNAYVAGHIHQVSARLAGTITEVLVTEHQAVPAGAVLARLDSCEFEVRRQEALAHLRQTEAQIGQAEAQAAQARAQLAREQAQAGKAQLDFERAQRLFRNATGAISREEFDNTRAALEIAQASLKSAKAAVDSADAFATAARAQQQAAAAHLQEAELQLSYTTILAPAAGRVGRKNLELGNRVQPGQALLAIVQPRVWILANLKETQLTRVAPGQLARLRLDTFPERVFTGHVESLAPASGAQFALLPPDNATGNFTKIVQRVPVKIVFDDETLGEFAGRLVPGMSVSVEIMIRD
jgi:membrane fusion protein (multidrug efflux system)